MCDCCANTCQNKLKGAQARWGMWALGSSHTGRPCHHPQCHKGMGRTLTTGGSQQRGAMWPHGAILGWIHIQAHGLLKGSPAHMVLPLLLLSLLPPLVVTPLVLLPLVLLGPLPVTPPHYP